MLNLLVVEPFYADSHKEWIQGIESIPEVNLKLLQLPGRNWKWRMHGGAVALTEQWKSLDTEWQAEGWNPHLILATDMLDLGLFVALNKDRIKVPVALYFHENQLTYPWSPEDTDIQLQRDRHYAFINYSSALVADKVFFNSEYHRTSFMEAIPVFLQDFPDYKGMEQVEKLAEKSHVLPLGMRLRRFDAYKKIDPQQHLLLWNHRWEYDKNPATFFRLIDDLVEEGLDFQVAILGKSYKKKPKIFKESMAKLGNRLIHQGYAASFEDYATLLWQATLLPVTSNQDFFGISVVEAMYCQAYPILPNRLAYPAHIPRNAHKQHFYEHYEGLKAQARAVLSKPPSLYREAQKYVEDYDWEIAKNQYLHAFCH